MDCIKRVFEYERLPADAIVRDVRFVGCSFIGCGHIPSEFALIERTTFERTTLKTRRISALMFRQVTFDTCRRNPLIIVANCLYDRVTMKGDFGSWFFTWQPEFLSPGQLEIAARFYDEVEWALDIRQARFYDLTLRGVPGDKILRDPKRHGLVRKDRLLADRSWEAYKEKGFVAVLRAALDRPDESLILSADDLSKNFEVWAGRLEMLRAAGFVE
jgi:hypothetical protein